jgi:hypothetical protein
VKIKATLQPSFGNTAETTQRSKKIDLQCLSRFYFRFEKEYGDPFAYNIDK